MRILQDMRAIFFSLASIPQIIMITYQELCKIRVTSLFLIL
jgi:hypothetical protein